MYIIMYFELKPPYAKKFVLDEGFRIRVFDDYLEAREFGSEHFKLGYEIFQLGLPVVEGEY